MCEYLAYDVSKLKRTRIMNVDLGNLEEGNWRELTNDEMNQINAMVSKSSKTEEASTDKQKKKVNTQSKRKFTPKNNNRFQPKNNKNSPQKRKRRG
jgi:23S rRNA pseudouridine2604 synthase